MPSYATRIRSLLQERMRCRWKGSKEEIYELEPLSNSSWAVYRTASSVNGIGGHCKEFTIWLEEGSGLVWWGNGSYYFDVSKFEGNPERITWYPRDTSKLPFKWISLEEFEEPKGYRDAWRGSESAGTYEYDDYPHDSHEAYAPWRDDSRWFGKSSLTGKEAKWKTGAWLPNGQAGWESEWTGERGPGAGRPQERLEPEPELEEPAHELRNGMDEDLTSAGQQQEAGKHLLGILHKAKPPELTMEEPASSSPRIPEPMVEQVKTFPEPEILALGPLLAPPVQDWEPPTSPPKQEPTIPSRDPPGALQDASSRAPPSAEKPQSWRDLVTHTSNLAMHWWHVVKTGENAWRDMIAANEAAVRIAQDEDARRPVDMASMHRARQVQQKAFQSSKSCIDAILAAQVALQHLPASISPPMALPPPGPVPVPVPLQPVPLVGPPPPPATMPCVMLPAAPAPVAPPISPVALSGPPASSLPTVALAQPWVQTAPGLGSLTDAADLLESMGGIELPPGLTRQTEHQSSAARDMEVRRSKGQKMPRPSLEAALAS